MSQLMIKMNLMSWHVNHIQNIVSELKGNLQNIS